MEPPGLGRAATNSSGEFLSKERGGDGSVNFRE